MSKMEQDRTLIVGSEAREAIRSDVEAIVHEALAEILENVPAPDGLPRQETAPAGEYVVTMKMMMKRLGVSRVTVLKREKQGKIPQRRTFPDGSVGWLSTDVDEYFRNSKPRERESELAAILASRIHH